MTAILSPAPEGGPYLLPEGGPSLRPRARASYYQEVVAFSLAGFTLWDRGREGGKKRV